MPGARPYDTQQLENLTQHMIENGPVVNSPNDPPEPSIVGPEFEHYPGRIEEAATALQGVARMFTQEGRQQRAGEKVTRLERRKEVVANMANMILDPRGDNDDPAAKLGWNREDSFHTRSVTWRPEDETSLGKALLDHTAAKQNPRYEPNELRPVTKSERAARRRLEARREAMSFLTGDAEWIERSYKETLRKGSHHLSRGEKRHMHGISTSIRDSHDKISRKRGQFDDIASSLDWRGRINERRLVRARRLASAPTRAPFRTTGKFLTYTLPDIAGKLGPRVPEDPEFLSDHYEHYLRTLEREKKAADRAAKATDTEKSEVLKPEDVVIVTHSSEKDRSAETKPPKGTRERKAEQEATRKMFDAIVPAIDTLGLELMNGQPSEERVHQIYDELNQYRQELSKLGIHNIEVNIGDVFDPTIHNGIMVTGEGNHQVVGSVLRWGFRSDDLVYRPADVVVEQQNVAEIIPIRTEERQPAPDPSYTPEQTPRAQGSRNRGSRGGQRRLQRPDEEQQGTRHAESAQDGDRVDALVQKVNEEYASALARAGKLNKEGQPALQLDILKRNLQEFLRVDDLSKARQSTWDWLTNDLRLTAAEKRALRQSTQKK